MLKQQRQALLVDRTEDHPQIRQLHLRIDRLRQELAGIPEFLPAAEKGSSAPSAGAKPPHRPAEAIGQAAPLALAKAKQEFRRLTSAADEADRAWREAAAAEQQAWKQSLNGPEVAVRRCSAFQQSHPPRTTPRLILAALAAGLATATGAGMISTGAFAETPLRSRADVEALLPVVGEVADDEPAPANLFWTLRARWALTIGGVVLVAGCIWAAAVLN